MTGDDIKSDVQATLVDAGIRWAAASLLLWINAGLRDIPTHKPKAATRRENLTLTAYVTKQANPEGVVQVLELLANMGVSGVVPGRSITTVNGDRLRAVRPSWRADKGPIVKHLVQDDRDPGHFTVWPAPASSMQVEALVLRELAPIEALADELPLDDTYRNAMGIQVRGQKKAAAGTNSTENPTYPAVDKNGA
jgi:hypothetical protein